MPWLFALRIIGCAGLGVFVAAAFTPLPDALSRAWGTRERLEPAEAIVVLASGVRSDGSLGNASLRRTIHGMRLYRKGLAPLLVLNGGGGAREAQGRLALAEELGVPLGAIRAVPHTLTTRDEARRVGELLGTRARHILLVTDSQHMTRARVIFERDGFEVLPAPVDDLAVGATGPEQRLQLMRWVLQEFFARIYYELAGYP